MAKKKEELIEDAIVISETTDLISATENAANLFPDVIPEKLFIPDKKGNIVEYSKEIINELGGQLRRLLKKVSPETDNDSVLWSEIAEIEKKLAQQRIEPNKERLRLMRPINDFGSKLKSLTDSFVNNVTPYEKEAAEKRKGKEDRFAELERKKQEELMKRAELRREEIRGLGGVYDADNSTFQFTHSPGNVVGLLQIQEYDDATWEQEVSLLQESYDKHLAEIKALEEAKEKELIEAKEKADAADLQILKYRKMELDFKGFVFDESLQCYTKNNVSIHVLSVKSYSDEDWDIIIEKANVVKESDNDVEDVDFEEPSTETDKEDDWDFEKVSPPNDALQDVVIGMVTESNERVAVLDGEVRKELVFTNDSPFIDIVLNKTFLRIFPTEKDDESTKDLIPDNVVNVIRKEEIGLNFAIVKL